MIGFAFRALPAVLLVATLPFIPLDGAAQVATAVSDSTVVQVGPFDFGKMWTFEYPPAEHFRETYGFDASPEWFERARLAALRIPGCSASFVSASGLVVTNHHCARGSISAVTREGERLLDDGFFASSMDEERAIPDTWADQLIAALDVTDEIDAAVASAAEEDRDAARDAAVEAVRSRLEARYAEAGSVLVQIVPLYNGGRFSAYVIRRFRDVRLVAAAELALGFFGGDPDNFTYPRYALDFAFYRVYENGEPYRPAHWFSWGDGVEEGDAVFVIGNPGPTNRLQTVAQLEYQRDALVPQRKAFFESRLQALRDAYQADPVAGERLGLRNQAFSLSNSLKAYTGRLAALADAEIMARKRAAEQELVAALSADAGLTADYGHLLGGIAEIQREKRQLAGEDGAFYLLGHPSFDSRALIRGFLAVRRNAAVAAGVPADTVGELDARLASIEDHPGALEEDLLALRLADLERYLGAEDPLARSALEGRSPEGGATALLARSVLATRAGTRAALEGGGVPGDDPAVALAAAVLPRLAQSSGRGADLARRERAMAADLGRARFAVYGTRIAPDATSSPRITDGVVRGYAYNGTAAPAYTTFFGLYDRHFAHRDAPDWALPDRWMPPPSGLDLGTPLNFVSTADTYGGNSGSPAVTRDLAIVGLNFDRNIEGLSRDFIYLPERGRNIMVDVRAIREALEDVYGARWIVEEILASRRD